MPANVLPRNQAACLSGCSDLVYHMDTTTAKPGATAASETPRKKRFAHRPEWSWHTAVSIKIVPQVALMANGSVT